ncbi:MAG TPA: YiaA/YiaB family inner membrane protein [Myxococcaceae bacterium]|nr:YiaA/YiaB family inner membrane protein [Myxococcaceae bacterium]
MRAQPEFPSGHSPAWVVQSWLSFAISVTATALGIYCLPDGGWVKGFLAMGLLFTVGSSLSLAKTVRDLHDATRLTARIDEARVSKLIAEHDPLKPAI